MRVDLLWADQPKELDYVTEMYDVMTGVRDGILRILFEGEFEVLFRSKFFETYWMKYHFGWNGDWLMEQRIRRKDRCTLTRRNSVAIFAGWQNLDGFRILVNL